jgi:hypothetical protein
MASDSERSQGSPSRYTCFDYRREMMLVSLKRRLAREDLSEAERAAMERAVFDLEKEIGLA